MEDLTQVTDLIGEMKTGLDTFKARTTADVEALRTDLRNIQLKAQRPNLSSETTKAEPAEHWVDVKSGAPVRVLANTERMSAAPTTETLKNLGSVMLHQALGANAPRDIADRAKALSGDAGPSGGVLLAGAMSNEFIDLARAQSVCVKAGARTVPMTARTLTMARITSDPVVTWHNEGGSITPSDPGFGSVTLTARTGVVVCKVSHEMLMDAPNAAMLVSHAATQALGNALDAVALNGASTDAGAAPSASGLLGLTGRSAVTGIGSPGNYDFIVQGMGELLSDNRRANALVGHPSLWTHLLTRKTGIASDQSTLVPPPDVQALPKLWTTAMPATSALVGDFTDLVFGVREQITVKALEQPYFAGNMQIALVIYFRVDCAAVRPASFCSLDGLSL